MWAAAIRAVQAAVPGCGVEVLPSDFKAGEADIATVLAAEPDVFAHNLETIRSLHRRIRPAFGYDRSLDVLRMAKRLRPGQITKSNLILGMGERPDEVESAMRDLVDAGCDILTMGQYLQPTPFHLPVDRWVTPEEFAAHARVGEDAGDPPRGGRTAGALQLSRGAPAAPGPRGRAVGRWRSRPVSRILCRPSWGRRRPSISSDRGRARSVGAPFAGALRSTRQQRTGRPWRCLLDLAPDGACRAAPVTRRAGGLLPHRFTLTVTANRDGGLFSVALPRGRPRPAFTGIPPYGVRTFLERRERRPRPPGRLLRIEHT